MSDGMREAAGQLLDFMNAIETRFRTEGAADERAAVLAYLRAIDEEGSNASIAYLVEAIEGGEHYSRRKRDDAEDTIRHARSSPPKE